MTIPLGRDYLQNLRQASMKKITNTCLLVLIWVSVEAAGSLFTVIAF